MNVKVFIFAIGMSGGKSIRSSSAPRKTLFVGEEFVLGGIRYRVVLRGEIVFPRDACRGCAFAGLNCPEYLACSSFDRRDGISVWFKAIDDEG